MPQYASRIPSAALIAGQEESIGIGEDSATVDWVRPGADTEEMATSSLQGVRRVSGLGRPMVIQPYRGFVAHGVPQVRARVREAPAFEAADSLRLDATLAANLLRWVVPDMPWVTVQVPVAGQQVTGDHERRGAAAPCARPVKPLRLLERGRTEISVDPAAPITCDDALQLAEVALQLRLIDDLTVVEVAAELGTRLCGQPATAPAGALLARTRAGADRRLARHTGR